MTFTDKWMATIGTASSLGAAGFWLFASVIPVRDDLVTFITALQRTSRVRAAMLRCQTELGLKAKGDNLRIQQAINHHFYYRHDRGDCPHG